MNINLIRTETWLSSTVLSSELSLSDYNIFRKDYKDGYGGVLFMCYNVIGKEYPLDMYVAMYM